MISLCKGSETLYIYIDIHNDILHVPGTKHGNFIFLSALLPLPGVRN